MPKRWTSLISIGVEADLFVADVWLRLCTRSPSSSLLLCDFDCLRPSPPYHSSLSLLCLPLSSFSKILLPCALPFFPLPSHIHPSLFLLLTFLIFLFYPVIRLPSQLCTLSLCLSRASPKSSVPPLRHFVLFLPLYSEGMEWIQTFMGDTWYLNSKCKCLIYCHLNFSFECLYLLKAPCCFLWSRFPFYLLVLLTKMPCVYTWFLKEYAECMSSLIKLKIIWGIFLGGNIVRHVLFLIVLH